MWESSVKATHLFLSEDEIEDIKKYVPQALKKIPCLTIAENEKTDKQTIRKRIAFILIGTDWAAIILTDNQLPAARLPAIDRPGLLLQVTL